MIISIYNNVVVTNTPRWWQCNSRRRLNRSCLCRNASPSNLSEIILNTFNVCVSIWRYLNMKLVGHLMNLKIILTIKQILIGKWLYRWIIMWWWICLWVQWPTPHVDDSAIRRMENKLNDRGNVQEAVESLVPTFISAVMQVLQII